MANGDMYLRKADHAADKMIANKKIAALSPEQHDKLAELCHMRHKMHTCGKSMFVDGRELHSYFNNFYLKIDGVDSPNLETIEWTCSEDYHEAIQSIDDIDEQDRIYALHINQYAKEKEELNNTIEAYLREIDNLYGTDYCPGGHTRIY